MPTLDHPYRDLSAGQWLRGNLHAHTTRSDGRHTPQELIDAYAARGYDFLGISDHDMILPPDEMAGWDARGLVLIPGNEITADGPHLLHVNADTRIEPDWERQRVLDQAALHPGRGGQSGGGLIIVNHPNWQHHFDHCPITLLNQWTGYRGIEVFNGIMLREAGSPYALAKWDMVLSTGPAGRQVWGFANDDTHAPQDVGRGWNMVFAAERSAKAIVQALEQGRFYASTGVVIESIAVEGMRIKLRTRNAQRIIAYQRFGKRFAAVDGPEIEVEVPPDALYARFECWGACEQFAWTQPFFVRE